MKHLILSFFQCEKRVRKLLSVLIALFFLPVSVLFSFSCAESQSDIHLYFSPKGSGNFQGNSPENTAPIDQMSNKISKVKKVGDIYANLVAGEYPVTKTISLWGAKHGRRLIVRGLTNGVVFKGEYRHTAPSGPAVFRFHRGLISLKNIAIQDSYHCVDLAKQAKVHDIRIESLRAKNIDTCIMVDRGRDVDVNQWRIENLFISDYRRAGIRLAGRKTRHIDIKGIHINGLTSVPIDHCHKSGIQILQGAHHISISDSTIENTIGSCGENFQQGDGIEVDNKVAVPYDIKITDVTVRNSGDAEFDIKARQVYLKNIIAIGGEKTHYAYKFWSYGDYVCENCVANSVNWTYVLLEHATAKFINPSFSNHKPLKLCDVRETEKRGKQGLMLIGGNVQMYEKDEWRGCGSLASEERVTFTRF